MGNSLATRILAAVVKALNLKEGNEVEITVTGKREFKIARDRSGEKAWEAIRRLARPLPPGFKFNCDEANER